LSLLIQSMRPRSHFERRTNQRVPTSTELWATCNFGDRCTTLRVKDFSISGALLVTEENIPVGTRLDLLFSVPEGDIRVLAVVRSSISGRGIGVEFVGMESGAFDSVLKLVKRLLE
jgi:PilZ domain